MAISEQEIIDFVKSYPFIDELDRVGLVNDLQVWLNLRKDNSPEDLKRWGW